ncbi:DUF3575 domain-containing protein [Spirosoma aureum]|uniref:DUF3575 domain-containing protein n=1 Tax=Spirosoma aureum TaxID=2692134 RepID=A0A6G9AJS9_9BACT|nr:DUF3575 domain-containing protein [Spirosoma aureum]QIP12721.1 DUF3575 domain-containing protein [Spirosoma aureum]
MHFTIIRLLLLLCSLSPAFVPVLAQDSTRLWSRPNVLKTNFLAPISVFYERALTPRFALRTSIRWWQFGIVSKDEQFVNATIEGKFYTAKLSRLMAKEHPSGFFINPYLKVRSLRYVNEIGAGPNKTSELDEIRVKSIGFGLTVGYMWVLKRGFVLELVHGGGFMPDALTSFQHTMRYSAVTSDSGRDYLMLDLRTGVSLGYAF